MTTSPHWDPDPAGATEGGAMPWLRGFFGTWGAIVPMALVVIGAIYGIIRRLRERL